MDHQAFAQLLGNYGEFVGSLGVVATLGYLVIQVRQNNRMLSSNTAALVQKQDGDVHGRISCGGPDMMHAGERGSSQ